MVHLHWWTLLENCTSGLEGECIKTIKIVIAKIQVDWKKKESKFIENKERDLISYSTKQT